MIEKHAARRASGRPASEGGPYKGKNRKSSVAGGGGGFFGRGVVAVAGTGYQFAATARGHHGYGDGAESSVAVRVGGVVGQNVLIANVVSDLLADAVHVIHVFRKVGQTTGGGSDLFKGFACALGFLLVFLTEQADCID